jgi:hypothetical protein
LPAETPQVARPRVLAEKLKPAAEVGFAALRKGSGDERGDLLAGEHVMQRRLLENFDIAPGQARIERGMRIGWVVECGAVHILGY